MFATELKRISLFVKNIKKRSTVGEKTYNSLKETLKAIARQGLFCHEYVVCELCNQSSEIRLKSIEIEELDGHSLEIYGRLKDDGFDVAIYKYSTLEDSFDRTHIHNILFKINWSK